MQEQTQVVQQETKEAITREFFNCAMCGHHILADRNVVDLCDSGVKTRCKRCNKSWETKMWKCKCNLPWHKCSIHRDSPQKMRNAHKEVPQDVKQRKAKKKEAERQGRKTQVSTRKRSGEKKAVVFTVEEQKNVQNRGLRNSCLSTSLKRKFGHLCTE